MLGAATAKSRRCGSTTGNQIYNLDAGIAGITRLAPQVERAEDVLGVALTLEVAPTL